MLTLIGRVVARSKDHKILIAVVKTCEGEYQGKVGIVESDDTDSDLEKEFEYIYEAGEIIPLGVARSWIDAVGDWIEERPKDEDLL